MRTKCSRHRTSLRIKVSCRAALPVQSVGESVGVHQTIVGVPTKVRGACKTLVPRPAIGTSARIVKPPLICPECVQSPSALRQSPGGHDHGSLYQNLIWISSSQQIKVAEKHAAYVANPLDPNAAPLYGVGLAGQVGSVPTYTLSIGLRTVDGQYNNLLPGQEQWGSADQPVPRTARPDVSAPRTDTLFDPDGPGPAPADADVDYDPSNNPSSLVFDSSLRTISNLIVDQTLGNPAAILKGLQVGGVVDGQPGQRRPGAGHLQRLQARARTPSISPAW